MTAEIILTTTDRSTADYDRLTAAIAHDLSASSNRVYQQTFRAWGDYCQRCGQHPLDLRPENVTAFLKSNDTTRNTRNRQLAALRKLAAKAHGYALLALDADAARMFEAITRLLADVKAPAPDASTTTGKERTRRALTPAQADRVLRCWTGDNVTDLRNHALIAVLLLTGIRRAEAAALVWSDVDFENGVITVRHGKGDKSREVPIAGDAALDALRRWQMAQPSDRRYIFCPVERGAKIGKDKPLSGTDVYRIVKATEAASGVTFKPHDCRRTLITEALSVGLPVHEVQAIAGHSRGDTTLLYAQTSSARERRNMLKKIRYG